jgi:hypothetical protein
MNRSLVVMGLLLPALLMLACASAPETVVFVTKTSLGVDVEQTPPSASIAYDRVEGYIGPRFDNGSVPPVFSTFATNGKLLGRDVKQLFATGNAARLLGDPNAQVKEEPALDGESKPMFFGTSTSVGLKIGFDAANSTSTFILGYKRKELTVIPATHGIFPAVLGTLQTDVSAESRADSQFGAGQLFATGSVATALAKRQDIRDTFLAHADAALDVYRTEERQQSRHALVTLSCLAGVGDAQLPRVWSNADALGLLDPSAKVGDFGTLTPAAARDKYTRYLVLLNADSADTTLRMNLHRQYVCGLAGR